MHVQNTITFGRLDALISISEADTMFGRIDSLKRRDRFEFRGGIWPADQDATIRFASNSPVRSLRVVFCPNLRIYQVPWKSSRGSPRPWTIKYHNFRSPRRIDVGFGSRYNVSDASILTIGKQRLEIKRGITSMDTSTKNLDFGRDEAKVHDTRGTNKNPFPSGIPSRRL